MDGEYIEMIVSAQYPSTTREKALKELGSMREELFVLRMFTQATLEKQGYCLCKLSVLHENNICVNCGLPYKHSRYEPLTLTDMPRPWSTDDMKKPSEK